MRIQVSEAADILIDYFVAQSEGLCVAIAADTAAPRNTRLFIHGKDGRAAGASPSDKADAAIRAIDYTGNPAQAAPILARLRVRNLTLHEDTERGLWIASIDVPASMHYGRTALIAALRCHLSATYGEYLDVPEALLADQLDYRNLWSTAARCAE